MVKLMAFQLDPALIRSFARETVRAFSLPPAPGSLDDSCSCELEADAQHTLLPPPPLVQGSCTAMDSYASHLQSSATATQKLPAKPAYPGGRGETLSLRQRAAQLSNDRESGLPEGSSSQNSRNPSTNTLQIPYPGQFGLAKRHGSVGRISTVSTDAGFTHYEGQSSTDDGSTHSEGESCSHEGGVVEDPNSDEEGNESTTYTDSTSLASDRTQKKDDWPTSEEALKPLKRRLAKAPWDTLSLSKGVLKSNSEQCACGHVFRPDDSFCLRCGVRRPVEIKPLPHVEHVRSPPIEDVVERLTACGQAYRRRKDTLKHLKRKNEAEARRQEHSGTPAINPLSHALAESLKPLSQRYKGVMCMKEDKVQQERERQAAESIMQYTGAPDILPKSKRLERSVDSLYRWKEKVERKTAAMRARSQDLEDAHCTFNPQVGRYSRRLASEHEEKNGNQAVYQRLYNDAQFRSHTLQAERAAMAQQLADMPKSAGSRSRSSSIRSRGVGSAKKPASSRCMPSPPLVLPSSPPPDEHVLPSPPPSATEFLNQLAAQSFAASGSVKRQLPTPASLNSSWSRELCASSILLSRDCNHDEERSKSETCASVQAASFRSVSARDEASVLSRAMMFSSKDEKIGTEETNCVRMTPLLHDVLAMV